MEKTTEILTSEDKIEEELKKEPWIQLGKNGYGKREGQKRRVKGIGMTTERSKEGGGTT